MNTKKTFSQKSAGAKILKVFLTFDSATAKKHFMNHDVNVAGYKRAICTR